MALTNTEKIRILKFLGWPAKTVDATSTLYSKIVSDRLLNLSTEVEAEVRSLLERFEKLEAKLDTSLSRAGVKRIDDIEFNGMEMDVLRKEKRKLVRELAILLDIGILSGSGSPSQGCVIA